MLRNVIVYFVISCALLTAANAQNGGSAVQAQTGAPTPSSTATGSQAEAGAKPSAVGLDQAVITLKGGCEPIGDLQPARDCVRTVTREQFEKLVQAMQPDMPVETKRAFALAYARILVFFDAAQAMHLEDDQAVQQLIQFVTKQVVADGVKRHYTEQFAHPTDQQIQAYYAQNSAKYVEAKLERIVIPRSPAAADKTKASDSADTAAAEKVRQRWISGEDPSKLQQAAYEAAGITSGGSPDITLGVRLPGSLPVDQESVFRLKAGEVSQVYSDSAAFYIYKVASTREIPLSEVKDTLVKTMQQQQLQDKLEEINKSAVTELNDQYFGPAPVSGGQPMTGRVTPAGRPANTPHH